MNAPWRVSLALSFILALAIIAHAIGWVLYVIDWITGTDTHVFTLDSLVVGAAGGWAFASPVLAICAGILGASAVVCASLLAAPLVVAGTKHRSPPTIFVSYHNSRQQLAQHLSEILRSHAFGVQFLPFDPTAVHNELLERVDHALAVSDFVVCLPGDSPSFVEAEVLAAATASRSIIFVVDYPDGRLPDTASKTYPVLMTSSLHESAFKPIVDLIRYLHGGWKETFALYFLPNAAVPWLERINEVVHTFVFVCIVTLFFTIWFGALTLFALEFFLPYSFKIAAMVSIFVGAICLVGLAVTAGVIATLTNGVSGIVRRQRAAVAAKTAIRCGTYTDDLLRAAFAPAEDEASQGSSVKKPSDLAFLTALWPERPLAHHESPRPAIG